MTPKGEMSENQESISDRLRTLGYSAHANEVDRLITEVAKLRAANLDLEHQLELGMQLYERLRAALEEIAQIDPLPTRQHILDVARKALKGGDMSDSVGGEIKMEADRLWQQMADELYRLRAEINRLRAALERYSDRDNWLWTGAEDFDSRWMPHDKPWEIARKALANEEEK